MPSDPQAITAKLTALEMEAPRDYFHGIYSRNLCLVDNLVVFLRTRKSELQKRNFESRPHHRWVLMICFQTEGSVNVDGRLFHLRPGEAYLVKPYQFHFYMELTHERIAWLFLTFETPKPQPFESFANTPLALSASLQDHALEIAEQYSHRESAEESALDQISFEATSLLNQIRTHTLKQSRRLISQSYPSTSYELVNQINSLLEKELEESISITRIASALSISESHLRKRFKQLTGLSLGSYLVHYKLNRAVKLLAHTNASLTQIAFDCGYDSLAAFSRSFKTNLGITPSRYRKTAAFEFRNVD